MKWKEFLKLSWDKFGAFIILSFIFFNFKINWLMRVCWDCPEMQGFPIPFYFVGGGLSPIVSPSTNINPIAFIIDVIIWYLLSCLIVSFFKKK